jgi:transcriptional regulator with XRE-family HTH domain
MNSVRDRIRALVAKKEMTFYGLAKASDVSYNTIFNLMNGRNETRPKIIGKIAAALGVTPEYLLQGKEGPLPAKNVVKDESAVARYVTSNRQVNQPHPPAHELTMHEVVQFLAKQFGLSEKEVMTRMINLLQRQ